MRIWPPAIGSPTIAEPRANSVQSLDSGWGTNTLTRFGLAPSRGISGAYPIGGFWGLLDSSWMIGVLLALLGRLSIDPRSAIPPPLPATRHFPLRPAPPPVEIRRVRRTPATFSPVLLAVRRVPTKPLVPIPSPATILRIDIAGSLDFVGL